MAHGITVHFRPTPPASFEVTRSGQIEGIPSFEPAVVTYELFSFIPLTVTYSFGAGDSSGSVDSQGIWSLTLKLYVQVVSLKIGDLPLMPVDQLEEAGPAMVGLKQVGVANGSIVLRSSFTLPNFPDTGPIGSALTQQLSGPSTLTLAVAQAAS